MGAPRPILGLTKQSNVMSRTIEASRKWEVGTRKFGTRAHTGQLIAEWQEGPTTISGYAPRNLRLVFASPNWEVGTRKFVTRAQLPTSHFRLPTLSAFAQTARGTTLGLSVKEERI
jgi:hypothetical protein